MSVEKTKRKSKPVSPKDEPEALDTIVPVQSTTCPVVGIGASAGGLEAFSQLLKALRIDTGMAFVVVQHLAPAHPSILAEILARVTTMPVAEVVAKPDSPVAVEANHVYVIPPGQSMTIEGGKLHLSEREAKGQPRVIDKFFSSLAKEQGHLSIGVILSGTATDGTLGLEEIKAAGGITFAQDSSAQFDGMPKNAVDSGCIDFELPADRIAEEIGDIASNPFVATDSLPSVDNSTEPDLDIAPILRALQKTCGIDFTLYQPNTLQRRIKRRMILMKAKGLKEYLHVLHDKPAQVHALCQDVLINVTSFFRDPEVFAALEAETIPQLLKSHINGEAIRVWVVGCSTGEEVYSLAILFSEVAAKLNIESSIQIFATDLSAPNIERARAGVYSLQRVQDLSPERLHTYFVEEDGSYRVIKAVREMCIFAKHDVLSDPPFSRMDIVTCRNLLIYLKPQMQERVLRTLHYSLMPHGCLVLGTSESVGQTRELFGQNEPTQKIFTKKSGLPHRLPPISPGSKAGGTTAKVQPDPIKSVGTVGPFGPVSGPDLLRESERVLVTKFAPPGVLVNQEFEILQFRGETEAFLAVPQGKATLNLLKMARDGLAGSLRSALQRAKKENGVVREEGIKFSSPRGRIEVSLEILPVRGRSAAEGGFLVLFESPPRSETVAAPRSSRRTPVVASTDQENADAQIGQLEQELAAMREYLQSVIEQQEATNEELQAANEEAQSANEELQSINEELETSKEEVQSSNEELITVNDELHSRNVEVGQMNNDLVNLIGSVNTAIVMVGVDLCIRRFSPMAEKLLNVIPSDIGRPITNISLNIDVVDLRRLLENVIHTLSPIELEVRDAGGNWFSLRIRPYITLEKKIDGAVMMLVDIDAIKRARDYAETIVQTVRQPIVILDDKLCIKTSNDAFNVLFKITDKNMEGRPFFEIGGKLWKIPKLRRMLSKVVPSDASFDSFELHHDFEELGDKILLVSGRRLVTPGGDQASILLAIEDVTKQRMEEAALALKERDYRQNLETSVAERTFELGAALRELESFNYTVAHDLRTPLRAIIFNSTVLMQELGEELSGEHVRMLSAQVGNSKRLATLIDDLLEFSRIQRKPVERQEIDVTALVNEVAEQSHQHHPSHKCIFSIQKGMKCLADATLFRVVITNLVDNACKFSPNGGTISVGSALEGGQTVYFVKDMGIGFDMTYVHKVFLPFERLHRNEEYDGTGIGLATVTRIVERHGGRVWVHSEIGKGTQFYFTFSAKDSV
jgi:two-component system CheB/CheR fusion protein